MNTSDPIVVAFIRAFYGAVLVCAASFLAAYAVTDETRDLIVMTGTPTVAYLMARGGIEGAFDQARKPNQNVPPASNLDD